MFVGCVPLHRGLLLCFYIAHSNVYSKLDGDAKPSIGLESGLASFSEQLLAAYTCVCICACVFVQRVARR